MKRVYIYTGNHGNSPIISDTVTMLRNGIRDCGYDAVITDRPVSGEWNLLIEAFEDDMQREYIRHYCTPGTRLIIVCTELVSERGFNQELVVDHKHYGNRVYWEKRFLGFLETAALADDLWVFAKSSVADYQRLFPDKRVTYFPHGWVSGMAQVEHRPERDKDIDFFFSGSLTTSRAKLLRELSRHHSVALSNSVTADYMRLDLLARTKVCLALPLSSSNRIPSVSRVQFHLVNQNFVLQQKYAAPCELDPYVLHAPESEFVEWAHSALLIENRREIAQASARRFRDEMPITNWLAPMLQAADGNSPVRAPDPMPRNSQHRLSTAREARSAPGNPGNEGAGRPADVSVAGTKAVSLLYR